MKYYDIIFILTIVIIITAFILQQINIIGFKLQLLIVMLGLVFQYVANKYFDKKGVIKNEKIN